MAGALLNKRLWLLPRVFCEKVQYHPRIDSISPLVGSLAGGTEVTLDGGGFPMNDADASVIVAGRKCVVTYASLEKIICNTTKASNATVPTKVRVGDRSQAENLVGTASEWMELIEVAGNWTEVQTGSPSGYFATAATGPSTWLTFAPKSESGDSASVATSGRYELLLGLPAAYLLSAKACRLGAAKNLSVAVRSGEGYSARVVLTNFSLGGSSGGSELNFVSLGNYTLLAGATTLVKSRA